MTDTAFSAVGAPQGASTSSGVVERPCLVCVEGNSATTRGCVSSPIGRLTLVSASNLNLPRSNISGIGIRYGTASGVVEGESPVQPPAAHLLKCLSLSPDAAGNVGARSVPQFIACCARWGVRAA